MSSRYPPPRDRSPPRDLLRRPSVPYNTTGSSYRGSADSPQQSSDRAPPRGPKADNFRGGFGFSPAPRGRGGFPPRTGDSWDRERERERDSRNAPSSFRREDDRADWVRRDRETFTTRDRPAILDRRESIRDQRSASPERPRRNSRENIPTTYGRQQEPAYHGGPLRGQGVRTRGRGDYDRGRGRSSFVGDRDRDGFFPRSRSREGRRDREFDRGRQFPQDLERGDRRDYDRLEDREARPRDHDIWPRDRSPERNSTGRAVSPGALSSHSQHAPQERHKIEYDIGRKSATIPGPLSARSEGRRENEADYFGARTEMNRGPLSATFSTTSVPQSASLGLDYGDAPSVPATPSAPVTKAAPSKPQNIKTESAPAPAALQPPSGPKADRSVPPSNVPSTPRVSSQPFEQWSRPDTNARSLRPAQNIAQHSGISDTPARTTEPAAEARYTPVTTTTSDRPLPSNIPSGPRAISGSSFKPRVGPPELVSPAAPPTAPRQPKAIENRQVPNAPTGPRGSVFNAPSGPHVSAQTGSSRAWVNPEFRQKPPSIMNQLNKPYQPDARDRPPYSAGPRPGPQYQNQLQQQKPKIMAGLTDGPNSIARLGHSATFPTFRADDKMGSNHEDAQMSLPESEDEDMEDEDALDEDYFAESEKSHAREMERLEAKKPLPPLQDPIVAALMIRIQLLGMLAQGIVPEAYEEAKTSTTNTVPMDIDISPKRAPLSPEQSPQESGHQIEHPKPRGRPLSKPFVNPIPTPPIDELPYLNRDMYRLRVDENIEETGQPAVFDDSEDEENQAQIVTTVEEMLQRQKSEEQGMLDLLETFYIKKFPEWKEEVTQLDRAARDLQQPSPAPASPAPSATPSLPGAAQRAAVERTRGARNTTDLDMEQAILMSQQSAREEEERREREAAANALPNYDTEAEVPFMLNPCEIELEIFEDNCEIIPQQYALELTAFIPPEDDFDAEEQLAFIQAYCQNPKKWGKIADAIPNRTYQECITHYYLTKDQAGYKEHWRRSQPKRRRGRQAAVKPRANNLMSDLALNEDAEGTPVAMTDSGRPRRAAAPTFGDVVDTETAALAPTAKRSTTATKEGTDNPTPKATRGRKPGTATRTRKPKEKVLMEPGTTFLAPAHGIEASPQKGVSGKEKARTILKAEAPSKVEPFPGHIPSGPVTYEPARVMPIYEIAATGVPAPTPGVTSYWSVPEHNKFKQLVAYYGRDYGAIANFLKTKSSTMIRNHYQKEVNGGKPELEQLADQADQRKTRGEHPGPPPSPVQPPKRRLEFGGTPVSGRPISANNEQILPEPDPLALPAKALVEDFPSNSIQRNATGEVVAKPRAPRENMQHSPAAMQVQLKLEEPTRSDRSAMVQKPLQGPPRGLFQVEDAPLYQSQHHRVQQRQGHEHPSHQQQTFQPVSHMQDYVIQQQQQQQQQVHHRESHSQLSGSIHTREGPIQSQQSQAKPQYQPHPNERTLQASSNGHSRNTSLATSNTNLEQAAAELASLRGMERSRNVMYTPHAAQSPINAPVQPIHAQRGELPQIARQQPPRPESAKPAPAKRSSVFGLLNDEPPPEPPAKRASTDSAKRSINTPPPSAHTILQHSRPQEELGGIRTSQPNYGHSGRIGQDYPAGYSSSPAPGPPNEWLDKFDPRQQGQSQEPRMHQSPALGPYSLVPPNSQASQTSTIPGRYDPARSTDQGPHRRSLLGINHAPSPPSQVSTPVPPHRSSSSTSATHQRGPSLSYNQHQQMNQPQVTGSPAYPHSTSSTPVSGLHQRGQSSIDYSQRRQTIQEHMAAREQQQQQRDQQHRDHDQTPLHGRREIDILSQQQQSQSQQQKQQPPTSQQRREPRDIYSLDQQQPASGPVPHHMHPPPPSQTPQPQHVGMGYQSQPSRTFTPPHGSYGQPGGPSSSIHGHHQQQQYQQQQSQSQHQQQHNQFGHQHHHQHQQTQQGQHQQQQVPPPPPPHYGGPPSHTGFGARTLGPGSMSNQDQRAASQKQSQHPSQMQGHYRGYSQDERR